MSVKGKDISEGLGCLLFIIAFILLYLFFDGTIHQIIKKVFNL